MKNVLPPIDYQQVPDLEDQIRRGVSLDDRHRYTHETTIGYAVDGRDIVILTPTDRGSSLNIELFDLDPFIGVWEDNPTNKYHVSLGDDLDDVIESIVVHLRHHEERYVSPCNRPVDERCSDCHRREHPCISTKTQSENNKGKL